MLNNLPDLSSHNLPHSAPLSSHEMPHHEAEPPHPEEPEHSALDSRMSRFGGLGHTLRSKSGKVLGRIGSTGKIYAKGIIHAVGRIGHTGKIYMRGAINPVGKIGSRGQLFSGGSRLHAGDFHNDSKSAFMSIFKKK